jgi:dGTPase
MTKKVQTIINDLFYAYMEDEEKMPLQFASAAKNTEKFAKARIVADYIAGMTDRYAIAAHEVLNAR